MPGPLVLAIDQGTTSSRALVVDASARVLGVGQRPFTQHFPHPAWVEHDPEEIWTSTRAAIADALHAARCFPDDLGAVGIANQRETAVLWERHSGAPVGRAIVWQDRRTAEICGALRDAGREPLFAGRTGLTLDPYFSGTKLTWMLRANPALRERAARGELAAGTVDSWLVWKLTGGARHVTDVTNASRTLLYNVVERDWDDDLCEALEVPTALLPEAEPSTAAFGTTTVDAIGARVPIAGIAGDQQAALFGQACTAPGLAKNTYGTGAFLLAPAGERPAFSRNRLLLSLGAGTTRAVPEYVVEGSVFVAGAAVQWLRDELGIIANAADVEPLAASVRDTGGVSFVPAFTGLGAPHWDPHARGALVGLTRGSTRAHIARAALEAIALSSADLIDAMNADLPQPIRELRVDGGAAQNDLLMQLQADLGGVTVVRPRTVETTALGAAFLAGLGAGIWSSTAEVGALWREERRFEPSIDATERAERRATWHRAIERARAWAEPTDAPARG
ncbi:MAG: glycerol kinase GlpK [Chloroflexi bacterium]|nr:glycerol kinase GlpK [Chloroflexota bacterium]